MGSGLGGVLQKAQGLQRALGGGVEGAKKEAARRVEAAKSEALKRAGLAPDAKPKPQPKPAEAEPKKAGGDGGLTFQVPPTQPEGEGMVLDTTLSPNARTIYMPKWSVPQTESLLQKVRTLRPGFINLFQKSGKWNFIASKVERDVLIEVMEFLKSKHIHIDQRVLVGIMSGAEYLMLVDIVGSAENTCSVTSRLLHIESGLKVYDYATTRMGQCNEQFLETEVKAAAESSIAGAESFRAPVVY